MEVRFDQYLEQWFSPPGVAGEDAESYLLRYTPLSLLRGPETDELSILSKILVDWRGLTQDGENIPCTPENVIQFVRSEFGTDRFMWMMQTAIQMTNFKKVEASIKNWQALQNGSAHSQKPMQRVA